LEEITPKDLIVDGVIIGAYNLGKIRDANGVLSGDLLISDFSAQIGSQVAGLVGTGILVKEGDGRLVLTNVNQQTATVVNGGILAIDNQAALGLGNAVYVIKGTLQTLQNMTISKNVITETASGGSINTAGSDVTLSGKVLGSGSLVKSGAGTLTLTNTNTHNATKVLGGTVSVAADTALGTQAKNFVEATADEVAKRKLSNITNSSIFLDGGILSSTGNITNKRAVNLGLAGGTIDVSAKKTLTLEGLVSGGGTSGLVKQGAGSLYLSLEEYQAVKEDGITAEGSAVSEQTFSGNTTIKEGVLIVDTVAKDLGKNTNVVLAGGELRTLLSSTLAGLT
jgi:fibronectin-binding autotransporter adhesin